MYMKFVGFNPKINNKTPTQRYITGFENYRRNLDNFAIF